jgi:hypothetical protein
MFVLNATHRLTTRQGVTITIPQGTELYPTACKLLWMRDGQSGKKTARYYIKHPMMIAGNSNNWWEITGMSFPSFKVSRIKRDMLEQWKKARLDGWGVDI